MIDDPWRRMRGMTGRQPVVLFRKLGSESLAADCIIDLSTSAWLSQLERIYLGNLGPLSLPFPPHLGRPAASRISPTACLLLQVLCLGRVTTATSLAQQRAFENRLSGKGNVRAPRNQPDQND